MSRRGELRHDRALDVGADVAGQQHRDVAVDDLQHDRVVVADTRALPVGRRRMQHTDARAHQRATPRPRDAAATCDAGRAAPAEGRPASGAWRRTGIALPERVGAKSLEDRRGAADVIGIAVREQQRVEPPNAARPERRREHAAPMSKRAAAERRAAGVDEHARWIGQFQQRRVPLADVEHREPQPAGRGGVAQPACRLPAHDRQRERKDDAMPQPRRTPLPAQRDREASVVGRHDHAATGAAREPSARARRRRVARCRQAPSPRRARASRRDARRRRRQPGTRRGCPPTCTIAISGTATRLSSSPALVTRENVQALTGSSASSAASDAASDASSQRRAAGAAAAGPRHAPRAFEQRGRRAERQDESGVAHVERPGADDHAPPPRRARASGGLR